MIKIRKGVFETNSSSMHSIAINTGVDKDTVLEEKEDYEGFYVEPNGVVRFYNCQLLEFDRYPFQILTTFAEKIRYAIASIGHIEEIEAIVKEYYPNFDHFEFPVHYSDGEAYCGSVDHQSSGVLKDFLSTSGVTLKEFLTNEKYMVIVDGDEYCEFDKLASHHIINPDISFYGGETDV